MIIEVEEHGPSILYFLVKFSCYPMHAPKVNSIQAGASKRYILRYIFVSEQASPVRNDPIPQEWKFCTTRGHQSLHEGSQPKS